MGSAATEDNADWARRQSSVLESIRYMYDHKIACDVTFLAQGRERGDTMVPVAAHKFVLISRSPVFFAMFCGQLMATDNSRNLHIEDVPAEAFLQLIRFLYVDEVDLTVTNTVDVLSVAVKYQVAPLIASCRQYIEQQLPLALTTQNVCLVLEKSIQRLQQQQQTPQCRLGDHISEAQKKCIEFIGHNTADVLDSEEFLGTSDSTLSLILQIEKMHVVDESDVLCACVRWAKAKVRPAGDAASERDGEGKVSELGCALKNVVHHIRFATMTLDQFSSYVVPLHLLDPQLTLDVFHYLTSPTHRCSPATSTSFETRRRSYSQQPYMFILGGEGEYQTVPMLPDGGSRMHLVECYGRTNQKLKLKSLHFICASEQPSKDGGGRGGSEVMKYLQVTQVRIDQASRRKVLKFVKDGPSDKSSDVTLSTSSCSVVVDTRNYFIQDVDCSFGELTIAEGDFYLTYSYVLQQQQQQQQQQPGLEPPPSVVSADDADRPVPQPCVVTAAFVRRLKDVHFKQTTTTTVVPSGDEDSNGGGGGYSLTFFDCQSGPLYAVTLA